MPELTREPVGDDDVQLCSYCRVARAVNKDHVMSRRLRRKFAGWDDVTVPACF